MTRRLLEARGINKRFVLHNQGGATLPVLHGAELALDAGDCVSLVGRSGSGKSTLLRMLYGNYVCAVGEVRVWHANAWTDIGSASPSTMLDVRRRTIGYVSQTFRVIPRRSTLDVVADPLREIGFTTEEAYSRARQTLHRIGIREALWPLAPGTFSGGEQQRVNVAKYFTVPFPILLLDEPTAALDQESRDVVLDMIEAARQRGAGILCTFHDDEARSRVCTGSIDIAQYSA